MNKKHKLATVFDETVDTLNQAVNDGYEPTPESNTVTLQEQEAGEPPLPQLYNSLVSDGIRTVTYEQLATLTPYLVKKLLHISASNRYNKRLQLEATKILLDKSLPNLQAVKVDTNETDIRPLVIIKDND